MITELSKRYAKALYEIAKANNEVEKVFSELRAIKQAIESDKKTKDFLLTPAVSAEDKMKILKTALKDKVSEETMSTFGVLLEKGRIDQFFEMVNAFQLISDEAHGVSRGLLSSAAPLTQLEIKKIEETVNKVTKKKIILSYEEDATLLGGTVAQVGGWTFDDSLRSHLRRLSEELNRRVN